MLVPSVQCKLSGAVLVCAELCCGVILGCAGDAQCQLTGDVLLCVVLVCCALLCRGRSVSADQ